MTPEEQERLYNLIKSPPPGSKIEAAKQYGVDLTLTVRNLALSPDERVRELEQALRFVEDLQRAVRQVRQ